MDFILLIKKIILAIVQGIAEILPISSSGHLLIFSELLQVDTNGLRLLIFLHFGSLVAMMIYYWKDIKDVITNEVKEKNKKTKITKKEKEKMLADLESEMRSAAANLDFERAMELIDIIFEMKSE